MNLKYFLNPFVDRATTLVEPCPYYLDTQNDSNAGASQDDPTPSPINEPTGDGEGADVPKKDIQPDDRSSKDRLEKVALGSFGAGKKKTFADIGKIIGLADIDERHPEVENMVIDQLKTVLENAGQWKEYEDKHKTETEKLIDGLKKQVSEYTTKYETTQKQLEQLKTEKEAEVGNWKDIFAKDAIDRQIQEAVTNKETHAKNPKAVRALVLVDNNIEVDWEKFAELSPQEALKKVPLRYKNTQNPVDLSEVVKDLKKLHPDDFYSEISGVKQTINNNNSQNRPTAPVNQDVSDLDFMRRTEEMIEQIRRGNTK